MLPRLVEKRFLHLDDVSVMFSSYLVYLGLKLKPKYKKACQSSRVQLPYGVIKRVSTPVGTLFRFSSGF